MYVLVWYKATLPLPTKNDGYYQIYGNVKINKKILKNIKNNNILKMMCMDRYFQHRHLLTTRSKVRAPVRYMYP